jgi:hypothetical protein
MLSVCTDHVGTGVSMLLQRIAATEATPALLRRCGSRYNHHGTYRAFRRHQGWIEAIIAVSIPAHLDASGKACMTSDMPPGTAEAIKEHRSSQRQRWMQWMSLRGKEKPEKDECLGSASSSFPSPSRRRSAIGRRVKRRRSWSTRGRH